MQLQSARIFSQLRISVESRQQYYSKIASIPEGHLSKPLLKSFASQKQRESYRVKQQDKLLGELQQIGVFDKSVKQSLTHFSFDVIQLIEPHLTFRIERHYVNLSRLYLSFFQHCNCSQQANNISASANSTNYTFKLEYYVNLVRMFLYYVRHKFMNLIRQTTTLLLGLARQQLYDVQLNVQQSIYSGSSTISIVCRSNLYTRRSRTIRGQESSVGNKYTLNHINIDNSIAGLQRKLKQIQKVVSDVNSLHDRMGCRFETNEIIVKGSSKNIPTIVTDLSRRSKRKLKAIAKESHFPRYVEDVIGEPDLGNENSGRKLKQSFKKLRRNPVSEECRINNTERYLSPQGKIAEFPKIVSAPRKHCKSNRYNRYNQIFVQLYGGNILQLGSNAVEDIDTGYYKSFRKRSLNRSDWSVSYADDILQAQLNQNTDIRNTINQYRCYYAHNLKL